MRRFPLHVLFVDSAGLPPAVERPHQRPGEGRARFREDAKLLAVAWLDAGFALRPGGVLCASDCREGKRVSSRFHPQAMHTKHILSETCYPW